MELTLTGDATTHESQVATYEITFKRMRAELMAKHLGGNAASTAVDLSRSSHPACPTPGPEEPTMIYTNTFHISQGLIFAALLVS